MEHRGSGLSRREFVRGGGVSAAGLGLLAGCGRLPGQAREPGRTYRIGYLSTRRDAADAASLVQGFLQGLSELGYVDGQNVFMEYRYPDGPEQLREFAADLARLPLDIVVASAAPAALALDRASTTVPIVMAGGGDPVRVGLAGSLGRPGGKVTGLSSMS